MKSINELLLEQEVQKWKNIAAAWQQKTIEQANKVKVLETRLKKVLDSKSENIV